MGVVFNIHIQVLGIRYFQRPCASYHCRISVISEGLVFYSHIQVLGIRYFQRPWSSYHCRISVISMGLIFHSHIQVLGIGYSKTLLIIVVFQSYISHLIDNVYTYIYIWISQTTKPNTWYLILWRNEQKISKVCHETVHVSRSQILESADIIARNQVTRTMVRSAESQTNSNLP